MHSRIVMSSSRIKLIFNAAVIASTMGCKRLSDGAIDWLEAPSTAALNAGCIELSALGGIRF